MIGTIPSELGEIHELEKIDLGENFIEFYRRSYDLVRMIKLNLMCKTFSTINVRRKPT